MFINGQILAVPDTSVTLPANKTSYVYLHASTGLVEANTNGFPGGALPIATAVTGTFDVLSLTDSRPDFVGANIGTPISFHNRIPRWMIANGNTAAVSIINDNASHTITTGANIASTATAPDQLAVTTSSTQNSPNSIQPSLNSVRTGKNIAWQGYGSPGQTANYRMWFGLSSITGQTLAASNSPAAQIAAFLASSDNSNGASISNYNCVVSNGVGFTAVDSGIAVAANQGHKFEIREDSASGKWYFLIDSALVATISTNVPSGAMRGQMCINNNTAATVTMNFGYSIAWTDN